MCKLIDGMTEKRKLVPTDQLGDNMIDASIRHNRQCDLENKPQEKTTIEETSADIGGITFAGTDTSFTTLTQLFGEFTKDPKLQEDSFKMLNDVFVDEDGTIKELTFDLLNDSKRYSAFISEVHRFFSIVPQSFCRSLNKDVVVDGYQFYKNDRYIFSNVAVSYNFNMNPMREKFIINRFIEEEKPEGQVMYKPVIFGAGKRICLGWQIADIFLKMAIYHFGLAFKYEMGDRFNETVLADCTSIYSECITKVSCRPEYWRQAKH